MAVVIPGTGGSGSGRADEGIGTFDKSRFDGIGYVEGAQGGMDKLRVFGAVRLPPMPEAPQDKAKQDQRDKSGALYREFEKHQEDVIRLLDQLELLERQMHFERRKIRKGGPREDTGLLEALAREHERLMDELLRAFRLSQNIDRSLGD